MRAFYDAWFRFGTPPWVGQARPELVNLVDSGVLRPGRALDLGCGVGDDAIFLARHSFEVTGVDFAPAAIAKARAMASFQLPRRDHKACAAVPWRPATVHSGRVGVQRAVPQPARTWPSRGDLGIVIEGVRSAVDPSAWTPPLINVYITIP